MRPLDIRKFQFVTPWPPVRVKVAEGQQVLTLPFAVFGPQTCLRRLHVHHCVKYNQRVNSHI